MVQLSTINVLFSLHALLIKIPVEMEFPDGEIEFFRTVRTVRFIVLLCFVWIYLSFLFIMLFFYLLTLVGEHTGTRKLQPCLSYLQFSLSCMRAIDCNYPNLTTPVVISSS